MFSHPRRGARCVCPMGAFHRARPRSRHDLRGMLVRLRAATGTSSAAGGACTPAETPVINFAAYSTPREAYGKIIPAFVSKWKEDHDDQNVIFQESYAGSTTQAANVIAGYEADVVALSLAPDVDQIADAGLITHDWTDTADAGMVSTSVVVFDVRPGNPLGIAGLGRPRRRRRRDPHPRPRIERRRALEPRVPVGRGACVATPA